MLDGHEKAQVHSQDAMTVLTIEALQTASGYYHILSENRTNSLCGSVSNESQFAAGMHRVLTRKQAENQGFDVCGLCNSIADS